MFSRYGAPRGYEQRIGMGNLGECTEDVGYWVRRCAYHWHHQQSAKPLCRLQSNFDGKKRQILCPSAKGSFYDSTILWRSNNRSPSSISPLLHGFITNCYISIVLHLTTLPPISRPNYSCWFWVEEMVKRWKESCTTISGRGWSQGFGAIFKDGYLGRDPEHDIWSQVKEWGWGCSCSMGYLEEMRKDGNG